MVQRLSGRKDCRSGAGVRTRRNAENFTASAGEARTDEPETYQKNTFFLRQVLSSAFNAVQQRKKSTALFRAVY